MDSLKTLLHWVEHHQAGFEGAFYRNEVKDYLNHYLEQYQQYLLLNNDCFSGHFQQYIEWSKGVSSQTASA